MILKSLEMQGFKSFPDKTVLRFDRGMTAVVGPNGSGKSNISDAIRWVLGEQSTKNLRGAKMEDVIFGGTAKRRALGFAEVTLRLDNTDRALDIDEDEVAVTRRFYRSGESEYGLNGETVRLKDIHELFMDTGLGRDGYSMVSQGKVAGMVSNRSSQRREMLEEAAGISHYRYRRADAMKRLSQAEENLVRLRDILSELEGRVGPLKVQSEKAQKFLVLAEDKKQLEIGLWLKNIDSLTEKLKDQDRKITVAAAQYQSVEKALEDLENEMEESIEATRNVTIEIEDIRNRISSSEEQISSLHEQIAVKNNTIEHNNDTIARIEGDLNLTEEEKQSVSEAIKEAAEKCALIEEELQKKRESLKSVEEKITALREKTEKTSGEQYGLVNELSSLTEGITSCNVRKSTAESSIREIEERLKDTGSMLEERNRLTEGLISELEEARNRKKALEEEVSGLENSINGYSIKVESRQKKLSEAGIKREEIGREIDKRRSRAALLEDLEKNMEGYTGSVKSVVRESRRGTLKGIHGPISQFITVDDEYSLAIETALGGAIQFVVTDDEATAKAAIQYLKKTKGGRATFLPLNATKSRYLDESGLESMEGFIDIASNLVKTGREYRNIIEAQLGRAVVVEDMDSAIRIGRRYKNRFKIVTLDGQVINAGGSMTGGSRVRNAGILSRSGEIEQLKKEVKELQKEFRDADLEYGKLSEEVNRYRGELEANEAEYSRTKESLVHAGGAVTLAESRYSSVLQAAEQMQKEAEQAESRIAGFRAEAENASLEMEALTEKKKSLDERADKLSSSMEDLAIELETASKERVEINFSILSLEKDLETGRDTAERLKNSTAGNDERTVKLREEIEYFKNANENLRKEIESLEESISERREGDRSAKEKIAALSEKRAGFEAAGGKIRKEEREKMDEREKISGEKARLEERKEIMQRDYENTINRLFDEYQLTRSEALESFTPAENPTEAMMDLKEIKEKIKRLGSVNVGAIEEYKEVSERYEFMSTQIGDVETSKEELLALIRDLTENMAKQFSAQFARINEAFGRTFVELFGGGKAALQLEDEHDILECAIDIKVQPPGKAVQNIDLLSGGEKGLSAIALLFSILKVTPAPFCVFDEVEAALDDVNVNRFAQYVRRMTGNTQFIVITHRRGTMEEADVMYGVTMEEEGVSKLLELKTEEMAQKLGLD